MSCTALPQYILLEDANDLCDFMLRAGRTVRPEAWIPEVAVALRNELDSQANEGLL
jgi:hypothetical protein